MNENPFVDHMRSPFHRGHFSDASHVLSRRNATCGDEVTLQLKIHGDTIEAAWFIASGCMVSQAAASILCEYLHDCPLSQAMALTADSWIEQMEVPLTPHRQQCAILCFQTLKAMLDNLDPTNSRT